MISTPTAQPTSTELRHRGGEQARGLRALVEQRLSNFSTSTESNGYCHSIVVAGGKGGSGRSIIATNLAIGLAQRGMRVGLVDASPDYGSVELLCGLSGYWKLAHVLNGCRELNDVVLDGPGGIRILPGGADLIGQNGSRSERHEMIVRQLIAFESQLDWLVVDASGGEMETSRAFVEAADDLLIVATPEPTSIAEAYATVKTHALTKRPRLGLLVNQADSADQAQRILDRLQQAAHAFLQVDLHRRGYIPRDRAVAESVSRQVPVVMGWPESASSQSLLQLAQRWTRLPHRNEASSFLARMRSA